MANCPAIREQINVDEDYDLRAWAEKFGVDKERLQEAVREVGSDAAAVERYLNRKLDA
jgi:hypothetical protein